MFNNPAKNELSCLSARFLSIYTAKDRLALDNRTRIYSPPAPHVTVGVRNVGLISANESYARGEKDLEKFTGIRVSHSTLQRLVKIKDFELPTSKQGVQEITLPNN